MYHGKKQRPKYKLCLTVWWNNGTVYDYDFKTARQRFNFYKKHSHRIKSTLPTLTTQP